MWIWLETRNIEVHIKTYRKSFKFEQLPSKEFFNEVIHGTDI